MNVNQDTPEMPRMIGGDPGAADIVVRAFRKFWSLEVKTQKYQCREAVFHSDTLILIEKRFVHLSPFAAFFKPLSNRVVET